MLKNRLKNFTGCSVMQMPKKEGYIVISKDHREGLLILDSAFNLCVSFCKLSWASNK